MGPFPGIELPSKTQISKAGKLLRRHVYEGQCAPDDEVEAALAVVWAFRTAHGYPMQKIRYGLRSMVRTEAAQEVLAQRLKRVPRILRKLHRMPACPLANLEDIGGVRAVLLDGPELERVRERVVRNWRPDFLRDPRDYIANPKVMGYRAVHFVICRDGRAVEVQLRTRGQQQWADAVESADNRLGMNLKDGVGPAEMIEYFSAAGEFIHCREYRQPISSDLSDRFMSARQAVIDAGYYTD